MSKSGPDLTKYMDERLTIKLNGRREVQGTLRGFDQFMNVVLEDTVEVVSPKQHDKIGTTVIRGNSIVIIEIAQ